MLKNSLFPSQDELQIPAIVVLYEPTKERILNLKQYAQYIDYLLILDNSSSSNFTLIKDVLPSASEILGNKHQSRTEELNSKYHYLFFGRNLGLCKALNIGINLLKNRFCWVLIMDDDSSFATNIVDIFKSFIRKQDTDNVAVLAPIHLFDRSKEKTSTGFERISWAMTSGCLYNINVFIKLGGFDNRLFLDCLDIDYCYKANQSGFKVLKCKEAGINHNPAQTMVFKFLGRSFKYGIASPQRYKLQCKNLFYLLLKYKSISILKIFILKWIKTIFFFNRKTQYLKDMTIGTFNGIQMYLKEKK